MPKEWKLHEDFRREEELKGSSSRTFGLIFTGFFLLVAFGPLVRHGEVRVWALGVAALFLLAALARPSLLAPLNRLWLKFGLMLHKIVNPIVMALMFFLTVTPIGVAMRLSGKDILRLRLDRAARSYWIERNPPGPAPDTMKNQF